MVNYNLYPLVNIVFPDSDFSDVPELFYNKEDAVSAFDGNPLEECVKFSFDTWMNLFASEKWYYYCELGNIFLNIELKGKAIIQIIGHEYTEAFGTVNNVIISKEINNTKLELISLPIQNGKQYRGISFNLIFPKREIYEIGKINWCTDKEPIYNNRIALVTCTFKRENYIEKTINKFKNFISLNKKIGYCLHLFVVDNGRTLNKEKLSSENITIIPNKNAGGAGGFGRGLMAANDGHYDRVLFMDDDVEIYPESFYRTLCLSNYLKDEYKAANINGPMMNMYDKMEMFENLAIYQGGLKIATYHGPLKVNSVANILEAIDTSSKVFKEKFVHSAWWYTCSSLTLYKDEYPVPVFLRGDDMEWSWRKQGVEFISINGICIWHSPFKWRVGAMANYYYCPRNMMLITMLHDENPIGEIMDFLEEQFYYLLNTYDYTSIKVLLTSITDFLKGSKIFEEDPEQQMKRIVAICKEADIRTNIDHAELKKVANWTLELENVDDGYA